MMMAPGAVEKGQRNLESLKVSVRCAITWSK